MDYKDLTGAIKLCGSAPKIDQCKSCHYWAGGDMSKCIPRMTEDSATAITELLARAEAAEARCETLEKMVKEYQDELIPGYRERAEKAERELRVAVGGLVGQCKYCRKNQECTSRKGSHLYCWEWRGEKEE